MEDGMGVVLVCQGTNTNFLKLKHLVKLCQSGFNHLSWGFPLLYLRLHKDECSFKKQIIWILHENDWQLVSCEYDYIC